MKWIKYLRQLDGVRDDPVEELVDAFILLEWDRGYGALIYVPPKANSEIALCGCLIFAREDPNSSHWVRASHDVSFVNIYSPAALDDLGQAIAELEYKYEEDSI